MHNFKIRNDPVEKKCNLKEKLDETFSKMEEKVTSALCVFQGGCVKGLCKTPLKFIGPTI
jgi:hypothetical protein